MNDNDLRVKVAELLGWTDIGLGAHWDGQRTVEALVGYPPEETPGDYWNAVPDYPNDLNACHEMEKAITKKLRYVTYLDRITGCDCLLGGFEGVHATARQRCEAFVKVMAGEK